VLERIHQRRANSDKQNRCSHARHGRRTAAAQQHRIDTTTHAEQRSLATETTANAHHREMTAVLRSAPLAQPPISAASGGRGETERSAIGMRTAAVTLDPTVVALQRHRGAVRLDDGLPAIALSRAATSGP
jgi:hypothetical protein